MIHPRLQVLHKNSLPDTTNILFKKDDWYEYLEGNIFKNAGGINNNSFNNSIKNSLKRIFVYKEIHPLLNVLNVEVNTSLDNMTETATITLNKKGINGSNKSIYINYSRKNLLKHFNSDGINLNDIPDILTFEINLLDQIEINMGIFDNLVYPVYPNKEVDFVMNKRFMGFVTEIQVNENTVIIKCEDNMGKLKLLEKKSFVMSGSNTLDQLLNKIKDLWSLDFDIINPNRGKSVITYDFTDITFNNYNPVDIFKYLTDIGLRCYFRRNILYIGMKYWNANALNNTTDNKFGRCFRFSDPWLFPVDDPNHTKQLNGTNPIIEKNLDYSSITIDDIIMVCNVTDPIINDSIVKDAKLTCYYDGSNLTNDKERFNWETSSDKIILSLLTGDEGIMNSDNKVIFNHKTSKVIELNITSQSINSIKDLCRSTFQSSPKPGFSGTITTYANPFIVKGDLLLISVNKLEEIKFNAIQDLEFGENNASFNEDAGNVDFYLPIIYDHKRNSITELENNSNESVYVPFWLYIADEVTYVSNNETGMRQIIRIEKIPKIYLDRNQALNSLDMFGKTNKINER